jgi:hypothetical protein
MGSARTGLGSQQPGSFDAGGLAQDGRAAAQGIITGGVLAYLMLDEDTQPADNGAWSEINLPGPGNVLWIPAWMVDPTTGGPWDADPGSDFPNNGAGYAIFKMNSLAAPPVTLWSQGQIGPVELYFPSAYVGPITRLWWNWNDSDWTAEDGLLQVVFGVNFSLPDQNVLGYAPGAASYQGNRQ